MLSFPLARPAPMVTFAGTLLSSLEGVDAPRTPAAAGLLFFLACEWPRGPAKDQRVAALMGLAIVACLLAVDAHFALWWNRRMTCWARQQRLRRRCGLTALVCSISDWGDAAWRSPFGGYLFGLVLNCGAVALAGQMIKHANTLASASGGTGKSSRNEERMMLAMRRGFMIAPGWSSFSVTPVSLLGMLPMRADPLPLRADDVPLGWGLDWLVGGHRTGHPPAAASSKRWNVHTPIIARVATILGLGLRM